MAKKNKTAKKHARTAPHKKRALKISAAAKNKSVKKKLAVSKRKRSQKTGKKSIASRGRTSQNTFAARRQAAGSKQSGDLQGLSASAVADSESVDELLEEGNAFEADMIAGVEEAENTEAREVHTHEVAEDDVPGEYLDEE